MESLAREGRQHTFLRFDEPLSPGGYEIQIGCASTDSAAIQFTVVEDAELPDGELALQAGSESFREATDYDPNLFPGTYSGLEGILVLPWNEKYTPEHVQYIGDSVKSAVHRLAR